MLMTDVDNGNLAHEDDDDGIDNDDIIGGNCKLCCLRHLQIQ